MSTKEPPRVSHDDHLPVPWPSPAEARAEVGPAQALAQRAAALAGHACVLVVRDGWLVAAASAPPLPAVGPLGLDELALGDLAPIRALRDRRACVSPGIPGSLWPPLAMTHTAYPVFASNEPAGVLLVGGDGQASPALDAALQELASLAAGTLASLAAGTAVQPAEVVGAEPCTTLQRVAMACSGVSQPNDIAVAVAAAFGVTACAIWLLDEHQELAPWGMAGIDPASDEALTRYIGGHLPALLSADSGPQPATDHARLPRTGRELIASVIRAGRQPVGVLALAADDGVAPERDELLTTAATLLAGPLVVSTRRIDSEPDLAPGFAVLQAVTQPAFIVDPAGRLLAANRSALDLWGVATLEGLQAVVSLGRTAVAGREDGALQPVAQPFSAVFRLGHEVTTLTTFPMPDGADQRLACRCLPIPGCDGSARAAVISVAAAAPVAAVAVDPTASPAAIMAERALALVGVGAVAVWRFVASTNTLVREAVAGYDHLPTGPTRLALHEGAPPAQAARQRLVIYRQPALPDPWLRDDAAGQASLHIPLQDGEALVGVLSLYSGAQRPPDQGLMADLNALAVEFAPAMARSAVAEAERQA